MSIDYVRYNLGLALLSPVAGAYLAQRFVSGKSRPGWSQRWGRLAPDLRRDGVSPRKRIWVHAVSAGEVVAAVPILRALRKRLSDAEILLSVITPTGHAVAERQARGVVDGIFYFPFDLPWVCRHVVRWIEPDAFVSMESELWPNLLHELKRAGASTLMVNGRISERNFRTASGSLGSSIFRWMLANMDCLLMQSETDASRIRHLAEGAARPPAIRVVGNSKFDQDVSAAGAIDAQALRAELKLPPQAPVMVAGSTRSTEEEAEVLSAYSALRESWPELCLILAPRHIERAERVCAAMSAAGFDPARRTRLAGRSESVTQLVLDTMGELGHIYATASVVFVGNSFPPVVDGGGQNLLQPLAHGKPVLFGPFVATARAEADLAREAGVGFMVTDGADLARQASMLLRSPDRLADVAVRALAMIEANRGASARYAEAIVETLALRGGEAMPACLHGVSPA